MTPGRLLSTLVLAAAAGGTLGLVFTALGSNPEDRADIMIGPAVRMETSSMDAFGRVTKEPPGWHLEIRLFGRYAACDDVLVTLSPTEEQSRGINAGAARRLLAARKRSGQPRSPRASPFATAFEDTLGCRVAFVPALLARANTEGLTSPVRIVSLRMDSTTVHETGWVRVFDPTGVLLAGRPIEVRP